MTLKLERVKRNLTQKELQELSGVSRVTIRKIEKGLMLINNIWCI